jgi:hypothetical protein
LIKIMKLTPKSFLIAAPLAAAMLCAAGPDTVTDQDLITYAKNDFDRGEMMFKHVDLGVHHGVPVVADFPCADVCPDNTTRIIHYVLDGERTCDSVGGERRKIEVPTGVGKTEQQFCVPRVLAARHLARWPQY